MPTIAVLGTFDTKGRELSFVAEAIRREGCATLLIDAGCLGAPAIQPDISADIVAAHGGDDWRAILARRDRGESVTLMGRAAAKLLLDLVARGQIHDIISLGGGGTAIATAAMRALPIGFPKVMVSTLASGNTAAYVGTVDIVMIPAIVDVTGINRISRAIFENAAGAICGMVKAAESRRQQPAGDKPLIVASMFGNTTACVNETRRIVEAAGYEVLVFAATGTGGRSMESLIASGMVAGVLDITTTEWADELGRILAGKINRYTAPVTVLLPRRAISVVSAPGQHILLNIEVEPRILFFAEVAMDCCVLALAQNYTEDGFGRFLVIGAIERERGARADLRGAHRRRGCIFCGRRRHRAREKSLRRQREDCP